MKPDHIIVVCTGNICRSPMGEKLLEAALAKEAELAAKLVVVSAGTHASDGNPAMGNAIAAMQEVHLNLNAHRSQSLSAALLKRSFAVLCMTEAHQQTLHASFKQVPRHVRLFCTASSSDAQTQRKAEVPDPYGSSLASYRNCRKQLEQAIPELVAWLKKTQTQSSP